MSKASYIFLILALVAGACQPETEKAAGGKFFVLADESFLPFVQAEQKVYEVYNKEVTPILIPQPEASAFERFLSDTSESLVASRRLSQDEMDILKHKNIYPQQYKIASDAVVFLTSLQRKDSSLHERDLNAILQGKITNWKQTGGEEGEIQLVFSGSQSADLLFLVDTLNIETKAAIYIAGSAEKVIDYVSTHPRAIGVIGLSWISDDPKTNPYLEKVKALYVVDERGKVLHPFQENLTAKAYPFKRDVFYITKFKSGLGTNFVSFVLSDAGQRLVLKFGLLPAEMPGREVNMKY